MATITGSQRLLILDGSTLSASLDITKNGNSVATEIYVNTAVSNLVASAPGTLDTLNELAAALGDDPNFATTVSTSIGTKLTKSSNLSDLTSTSTARTNLGLGALATLSTVNAATITDNSVGAAELNVSGNGTTAQFLRSDGDGTFSWVTPTDTNTTYSVGNGGLTEINFTSTLNTKLAGIATNANNYVLPFTNNSTNWNTAYGWGNHASAGYQPSATAITTSNIGSQSVTYATTAGNSNTVGGYYAAQIYTSSGNAAGSYLGGHYSSGGAELPNSPTFGAGKLKLAMISNGTLGFGGSWNDVLWLSAYSGGDVKSSHALVFDKYSPNVWVSDQNFDSATWGTGYLLLHSGNYTSYVPSLTGTGASGTWGINITGNATTATTAGSLTSMNISQFTNNSGYLTSYTDTNTTYTAGTGLTLSGTTFSVTSNGIGATQLNVTGNGTTAQFLRSDGDGTFTWATPTDTNTTYSVGNGGLTEINFTSALNTKLAGIATGANNYVLPFTDNSTQWNTAYGWGNHASAGYLLTSGKAADSNLLDGIDSTAIVYGAGPRASTQVASFNDPNQKSGFYYANGATGAPNADWQNWITVAGNSWQSSNNYMFQLSHDFHNDILSIRGTANGTSRSWRTVVDSANYNNYVPTKTGGGASGTWAISITGNAATATTAPNGSNANQFYNVLSGDGNGLRFWDGQDSYKISMGNSSIYHYGPVTDYSIKTQMNGTAGRGFTWGTNGSVPIAGLNSVNGDMQIAGTFTATGGNSTQWNTAYGWGNHASAGYLTSYTDTNTTYTAGSGLSLTGTVFANTAPNIVQTTVSGNAGSATVLQTARTINGVSFNGSANITVADSTKLPLTGGTLTGALVVPYLNIAEPVENFNPFGQFKMQDGILSNALVGRWDRFDVTIDGTLEPGASIKLSNQNFEEYNQNRLFGTDAGETKVFNINVQRLDTGNVNSNGITYAAGYFDLCFYSSPFPASWSARVKNRDGNWTTVTSFTKIGSAKLRGVIPIGNYLTDIEFTLTARTSAPYVTGNITYGLAEFELFFSRMAASQGGNISSLGGYLGGTITTNSGITSTNWNTAYGWGNHASQGYATQTYVNTAVSNLVSSAPGTLDTLNELAAALGDDPNFATTVTNSIAGKLSLAGGTMTGDIIFNNNIRLEYSTTHWITPRDSSGNMHLRTSSGGIYLDAPVIYFREVGSEGNSITVDNGTLTATGIITASGGNSTNWNTAYGWGNHASAGYLTTYTDTNTTYSAGTGLTLSGTTFKLKGGEIPASADLNHASYRATGIYSQNSNSDAASGSNYPVALAGILEVWNDDYGNGSHCLQRYSQYNSIDVFQRNYYNGSWSAWRNLTQDNNTTYTAGTGLTLSGTTFSVTSNGIGATQLNVSGNGTTAQFLRSDGDGTFTWATPTDTNTTYSVGNGGLTEINFTSALNTKLAGIATNANNYVLPFTNNSTNWNTAYGWGNHASAGYQPSATAITTSNIGSQSVSYAGNAGQLDSIDSTQFLRSDADDSFSGKLVSTNRAGGIFGTYDSTKTDHIWSMGASYVNDSAGTNFGNLYGLAYKHTNNPTGGTMAGGHQMVWCSNGSPRAAMGDNIWTAGTVTATGGTSTNWNTAYGWGNHASAGYLTSYTDTNTTYTAGGGLTLTGTVFSHTDTSSQASVNNSGRTYIQDITLDAYGHITGITSATETVVNTDTNTTYTAGTGLALTGTVFSNTITNTNQLTNGAGYTTNTGTITGSGTTNYVPKLTSATALGNSSIFDNGNVGIGTASPSHKLHVSGNRILVENITDAGIMLRTTGVDRYSVASTSGNFAIHDEVNSVDRLHITSAGDVGIGTTSPTEALDVSGIINAVSYSAGGTAGFTGMVNIPTNPPVMLEFQGGLLVGVS